MSFKNALTWVDENLLFILAAFLLMFIPLYPKIPLAELIPGYIVRLRVEDIVIGFAVGIWCIQLVRKKVSFKTPLTLMICLYLITGLLSSIFSIYWTKTVPISTLHISKLFLHYIRRIEYFSVFFIFFSAVRKKKHAFILFSLFIFTTLLVSLYGVGQKYLYWPVYSTMNREFSKGLRLYLTQHARVQSTFGGHYDFAAFLVIALPALLALGIFTTKRWIKGVSYSAFVLGLWGLMMTSSRSSFLAYLAAITILLASTLRKNLWIGLARFAIVIGITFSFLFLFGDLSERFSQVFSGSSAFFDVAKSVKEKSSQPFTEPPSDGISIEDVTKAAQEAQKKEKAKVVVSSDTRPSTVPDELPPDVYEDIPDRVVSTKSTEGEDIEIMIPRVFSENAHRLGLSAAIRLDTLWPFAIRGFLRNPLFGSGYSTLTKYSVEQFTEAESTDNDFLRTLGETGLLGFIFFYGTMIAALIYLKQRAKLSKDQHIFQMFIVLLAVTIGLLINGIYIDVFVSSKVIETYWAFVGTVLAFAHLTKTKKSSRKKELAYHEK